MSLHVKIASTVALGPVCINWSRCCICQNTGTKNLICPSNNPVSKDLNSGYRTIASVFEELNNLNYTLPCGQPIANLNQGDGILQALITNQAKWHKKCYASYRGKSLDRIKRNLKKSSDSSVDSSSSSRVTRATEPLAFTKEELCFLCTKPKYFNEPLLNVATTNMIHHIKSYAQTLQDSKLLAILSAGDLVAQEAKYHKICLTRLYTKTRCNMSKKDIEDTNKSICEGMAFAELVSFIRGKLNSETDEYIFKVPELIRLYQERLSELLHEPIENLPAPHTTRFREKLLIYVSELKEIKSGREYILARNLHGELLQEDVDGDALIFERFIRNVRKSVFDNPIVFEGKLSNPENQIPHALLAVVNTFLYGSSARTIGRETKPAHTICELIMYNIKKKVPTAEKIRNKSPCEPALPLYMGLKLYGEFRSKNFIDKLHELGISISSTRVMEITSAFCHLVVERSREENVLCPSNLKKGLFTVAAIDNVDHNPSSTTSTGSFHGTSISLFQLATLENKGQDRIFHINYKDVENRGNCRSVPLLPEDYAMVPDYALNNKQPAVPKGSEALKTAISSSEKFTNVWKNELDWLRHVQEQLAYCRSNVEDTSWAAFHASKGKNTDLFPSINALLPLFHEHAASAAMIHHGMDVVKKIITHLHADQVPVLCADQPLYTLAKNIQWNCPEYFGEDKFVLLFGSFHIEQNFLRVLGQFLVGSGWVGVVTSSGVIEKGSAEAILKVTHVTKARVMHQVTAAVLQSLMQDAYEMEVSDGHKDFETWLAEASSESPTMMFWLTVLNLEVLLLNFVKSVREGDFSLYKESLKQMMPWFFVFDHTNYARWIAVHLKDLEELSEKVPSVHQEFCNGNFVVRKTGRPFSGLGIDQAHEQYNAEIKAFGGAIGLTQDPASLRRFTTAGPEISRLVKQFESMQFNAVHNVQTHHEQYPAYQKTFIDRCVALKTSFIETGNPFIEHGTELLALDTRVVASSAAITALYAAEKSGNDAYQTFIIERFVEGSKSIHDTIKKMNTKIFAQKTKKDAEVNAVKSLKVDIQLYSRLFIIARERELDLVTFFEYENQRCPPSLSANGQLRSGIKADLAERLESLIKTENAPIQFDGIIFDGAALTQMIRPKNSKTFQEYYLSDLKPHVLQLVQKVNSKRIDLVWDLYLPNSLKKQEREGRGAGIRRQVLANNSLPSDWSDFLRNEKNKSELFQFLGQAFLNDFNAANVVTNVANQVRSSNYSCTAISGKTIETHAEEADGRIVLHAKDMAEQAITRILIRSSDTDVLVLLISFYQTLIESGLQELWLLSGTANKRRYIEIHKIANTLGPDRSTALRGFHAFTGCDTTSYFHTKGKKSCFKTWLSHPEVTPALIEISQPIQSVPEETMAMLEKFICYLYDSQTAHSSVNLVRKELFATKNKLITSIPPTSAALQKHALRATYQAGHLWGNALTLDDASGPSPSSWGWNASSEGWVPQWSEAREIWPELSHLDRCSCKKGCETMRCSCRRVGLPCTVQCSTCKGSCKNESSTTSDEAFNAADASKED